MTRGGRRGPRTLLLAVFLATGLAGNAAAVEVGQKAPDFILPGTPEKPVRLSQYAGKTVVVLHFYLGDFLPA